MREILVMGAMVELDKVEEERARALHANALVLDACALDYTISELEWIGRMQKGGVNAINYSGWELGDEESAPTLKRALNGMDWAYGKIEEYSGQLSIARTGKEIKAIVKEGKIAVCCGMQFAEPLEGDLTFLRHFYRLGVRCLQLTYNARNLLGDGCGEVKGRGLTTFGMDVVQEMNRLGMVVDLSHVGDETTDDAIALSRDPVVCTHSNARSVCENVRNKPDEQIQAIAEKGGVLGVVAFPAFVSKTPNPTIQDLLDHVDYMVNLVGADHVGFGGDYIEGRWEQEQAILSTRPDIWGTSFDYPKGIDSIAKLKNVTRGLVARGYSDAEIAKILGGNFLRVFEQVIG